MAKKESKKITDSMIVPANGRPDEVKVGYRTIKIKYVRPDFIMDDMMESTGTERVSFIFKTSWCHKSVATLHGMRFYMRWSISLVLIKQTVHLKKTTQKN